VLYLLEVDALIAAFVLAPAALIILALLVWRGAERSVATFHRRRTRVANLLTQP
jgi:hypothetical protein